MLVLHEIEQIQRVVSSGRTLYHNFAHGSASETDNWYSSNELVDLQTTMHED